MARAREPGQRLRRARFASCVVHVKGPGILFAVAFEVVLADFLALVVATLCGALLAKKGFPVPEPTRRFGCVDGLRGYLALAVTLSHAHRWLMTNYLGAEWHDPRDPLPYIGPPGVALFFMTTGLVFYPRVLAGLSGTFWPAVYISRVFRLMPLILVSVALMVAMLSIYLGELPNRADILPIFIWITTYAQPDLMGFAESWKLNAGVLWTLWIEWCFYVLLLPATALAMQIARWMGLPSWIVPSSMTLGALAGIALEEVIRLGPVENNLPFIALFAAGMAAHELQARPAIARFLRSSPMSLIAVVALVVACYEWQHWHNVSLLSFGLLMAFFACVAAGNSLWGLLESRGALVLGECSYGIYLFHGIVLFAVFNSTVLPAEPLSAALMALTFVPIACFLVGFTALTYLLVERPMIARGKALARAAKGRRLSGDRPQYQVAP